MFGIQADILVVFYVVGACYTAVLLWRGRRGLFDGVFTRYDQRMASLVGFLYLTPVGVLAHEAAHLVVARSLGAADAVIHYHLYWGFVSYDDALDPTSTFLIFAAGPAMSTLLGLAAFALALRLRSFARVVFWTFGSATLLIVLLVYPIFSFIGPVGDFQGIYSLATPRLSLLAAVVHLSAAVVALRLNRRIEKLAAADLRRPSRHPPLSISTEMERGRG